MVKGGVVGLGLATAALFWVFGGRAWDLIQAKAEKGKEWVRANTVSFEDELTLAKKQVEKLGPALGEGAEALSKLEESVDEAKAELGNQVARRDALRNKVETLTASLDSGNIHRVGGSTAEATAQVKLKLAKAIDAFKLADQTVGYSQDTLTYRQAQLQEARARLDEMKAKRLTLMSKIKEIEARHKARVAQRQFNEFTIDTSPMAEADRVVSQLDRRENTDARADKIKSDLAEDDPITTSEDISNRDVQREAAEILKTSGKTVADHDA
jgi:chromosome segregation ATPase